jgi:hypothetical protein
MDDVIAASADDDDTGFDTLRRSTELFQQDSFNEGSCYEDRLAQSKSHQLHIVLD